MDDADTLRRFKASLNAPFPFIADPDGKLVNAYDVKTPVLGFAQRFTFVIGEDRRVIRVDTGADAIDASKAVTSCPIRKNKAGGEPPAWRPPGDGGVDGGTPRGADAGAAVGSRLEDGGTRPTKSRPDAGAPKKKGRDGGTP